MAISVGGISRVVNFVRLGRPHFLVGGFVMDGLGVAAALYAGASLNLAALIGGQIAITAIQWMVHYANDYFDLEADRANQTPTAWSGGSRMLQDGYLAPRTALITALCLALLAVAAALFLALVVRTGPLTLPIILLTLLLAWGYSAPPIRLHARGLGELTTTLIVPGLTPILGFYLQSGRIGPPILLAIVPLLGLQLATHLSVNFPDALSDAAAGKRTLVVRYGTGAGRLYVLALIAAYAVLPLVALAGLPPTVAAAAALTAPLAAWQAWRIARGAWARPATWSSVAFVSIILLIGTAALEGLAFLWPVLQTGAMHWAA